MSAPVDWPPAGFAWDQPDTWPDELRQCFEYAAQFAYLGLIDTGKKMLNCQIEGTVEPVTMLFAIGERADDLRRAWQSVIDGRASEGSNT